MNATAATSLTVRDFDEVGQAAWDEYVESSPTATLFHLSAWRSVLTSEFRCRCRYLAAVRNNRVVGVLPLAQVKNLLSGNVLISTPFLVCGGPDAEDADALRALTTEAESLGDRLGVDYIEMRNKSPLDADWLVRGSHAGFRRELKPTVEENLAAIPRKQRAVIRKGKGANLEVRWDLDIDGFYRVFCESYRNLGTPVFAKSLFMRLAEVFEDRIWLTTLWKDDQPISGVMSFVFRDEVLPYYGGGGVAARDLYANDLMYWEVMERATREGLRWFDFGRSKIDSGSYRFKRHWGFEAQVLPYQYRLVKRRKLKNLSPSNPIFKLPIEIWKRLPIRISNALGPHIARRLA